MMNWFLKYVLGGVSKATEFALFVFLTYLAGLAAVFGTSAWLYYNGIEHDFSQAVGFAEFITPWVIPPVFVVFFGKLAGTFGFMGAARGEEFSGK